MLTPDSFAVVDKPNAAINEGCKAQTCNTRAPSSATWSPIVKSLGLDQAAK
jgi:hypothetical protein